MYFFENLKFYIPLTITAKPCFKFNEIGAKLLRYKELRERKLTVGYERNCNSLEEKIKPMENIIEKRVKKKCGKTGWELKLRHQHN